MPTCDSLVDLLPKGMCRKFDADSALCVQHRVGRTPCVWQQEPGCRRSRDECSVSQKSMPRTRAESSRATAQPLNLTSEFISRDYARAGMLAHALRPRYKAAQPFPHIRVDDLFCRDALTEVAAELPETMDPKRFGCVKGLLRSWQCFNKPGHEYRKSFIHQARHMGPATKRLLAFLRSEKFISFLEQLSGIKGLMPDPMFEGAGLHMIGRGGYLQTHADFNHLPPRKDIPILYRRVNTFIVRKPPGSNPRLFPPCLAEARVQLA